MPDEGASDVAPRGGDWRFLRNVTLLAAVAGGVVAGAGFLLDRSNGERMIVGGAAAFALGAAGFVAFGLLAWRAGRR